MLSNNVMLIRPPLRNTVFQMCLLRTFVLNPTKYASLHLPAVWTSFLPVQLLFGVYFRCDNRSGNLEKVCFTLRRLSSGNGRTQEEGTNRRMRRAKWCAYYRKWVTESCLTVCKCRRWVCTLSFPVRTSQLRRAFPKCFVGSMNCRGLHTKVSWELLRPQNSQTIRSLRWFLVGAKQSSLDFTETEYR